MWQKFFITDTSIIVSGLRFGYGFVEFSATDKEPLFLKKPENIKLYDKLEEVKVDYDQIKERVAIWQIAINGNNVHYGKIEEKK